MIWGIPFSQVGVPDTVEVPKGKQAIAIRLSVVGPFEDKDEHNVIRVLFQLTDRPEAVWICDREPNVIEARRAVESGRTIGSLPGTKRLFVWDEKTKRPELKVNRP